MTAPNDPIIIDYAKPTLKERTAIMFHQLPKATSNYLINLVPIAQWIHQYRLSVSLFFFMKVQIRILIRICSG